MAIGEDISEDKTRPVSRPKQKCNLAKIKQRLEERRTKEENMKTEEEKLRPTFHNLSVKMIEYNFWPEVEKNRKNLEEAGIWDFLLIPLEPQDNARTRQFLNKSVWGSKSKINMDGRIIHFTAASISKTFKLPQSKETMLTEATALTSEMLLMVFNDKKAKTRNGFSIGKAKGIWKLWLPWVNERILLAESGVGTIPEAGLALAIMAWQRIQLSWGNILYEQMKLELMKKHRKGVLTLYSIPYITYLTSPLRVDGASQLPVSTINLSIVVQPVPTSVNPPPTTHLIQVGDRSDIPGPSQPKKRKRVAPVPEEEVLEEDAVEIPPYKFNHIPDTMLQRDTYWRTYINVVPEETLYQFEQAATVQDVGACLQAFAIREREAQSMILEGMKRESQYKKEVVELKLSLSNMTRLNETLSKE